MPLKVIVSGAVVEKSQIELGFKKKSFVKDY